MDKHREVQVVVDWTRQKTEETEYFGGVEIVVIYKVVMQRCVLKLDHGKVIPGAGTLEIGMRPVGCSTNHSFSSIFELFSNVTLAFEK
jgi:hypothetical protein